MLPGDDPCRERKDLHRVLKYLSSFPARPLCGCEEESAIPVEISRRRGL